MKVAALDLGSNTFLCLIAEVEKKRIIKIYEDQVQVVRLGQGLFDQKDGEKKLQPEALARAKKCLTEFSELINKHKPEKILAMATSAARDAVNSEELFQIGRELNIPIEIIPGPREAEITYLGGTSGLSVETPDVEKNTIIVDIGGGSTELIYGVGKKILFSKSLDIGCVRLTEKFLPTQPPSSENIASLQRSIRDALRPVTEEILAAVAQTKGKTEAQGKNETRLSIIAVAGTPTELAKIEIGKFDAGRIDGYEFSLDRLKSWQEKFAACSAEQIMTLYKASPGRADVLLVGVMILIEICEQLAQMKIQVSTRGVRYGIALEISEREEK